MAAAAPQASQTVAPRSTLGCLPTRRVRWVAVRGRSLQGTRPRRCLWNPAISGGGQPSPDRCLSRPRNAFGFDFHCRPFLAGRLRLLRLSKASWGRLSVLLTTRWGFASSPSSPLRCAAPRADTRPPVLGVRGAAKLPGDLLTEVAVGPAPPTGQCMTSRFVFHPAWPRYAGPR